VTETARVPGGGLWRRRSDLAVTRRGRDHRNGTVIATNLCQKRIVSKKRRHVADPHGDHLVGNDAADEDTPSVSAGHHDGATLGKYPTIAPTARAAAAWALNRQVQTVALVSADEDLVIANLKGQTNPLHAQSHEQQA
jgi:hypothetical protein